jgi:uncharacterized protein YdeI (YjbR/CyaY-like superfamily)
MKSTSSSSNDLPILQIKSPDEWTAWLDENHTSASGAWLQLAKKSSGMVSITYAEAVDVALRYGWIDSQSRRYDDTTWLQKFTPRGDRSIWSQINRARVEELIRSGEMKPAGLQAVERAQQNGRWEAAYASPSQAAVPDDFQAALDANERAKTFFAKLNSQNRYAILHRIQIVKKAETRARRIEQFIQMLEKNEKVYP